VNVNNEFSAWHSVISGYSVIIGQLLFPSPNRPGH